MQIQSDQQAPEDERRPTKLLRPKEVAELLSVSLSTVKRMVRAGELPVRRVHGLPRFVLDEVIEALPRDGRP